MPQSGSDPTHLPLDAIGAARADLLELGGERRALLLATSEYLGSALQRFIRLALPGRHLATEPINLANDLVGLVAIDRGPVLHYRALSGESRCVDDSAEHLVSCLPQGGS